MNGFYKVTLPLVIAGYMATMVACDSSNPVTQSLQPAPTSIPLPTTTLQPIATLSPTTTPPPTTESTTSPPEPIKTLEERIMPELSPLLSKGELTYSKLYRTVAEDMGFEDKNPDTPIDEFGKVNIQVGSIVSKMELGWYHGVVNDYLIPNSLADDAISSKVKSDIRAYDNLKNFVWLNILAKFQGQHITKDTFSNYILTIVDYRVSKDIGFERMVDLSVKLIKELWDGSIAPPKNSGSPA